MPDGVKQIDRLNEFIGRAASYLTVPMIAAMIAEVVLRYFFNAPTIWALEATQILYGFMFLLGAGYTLKHDGHVRVEIAFMYTQKRTQAGLRIFSLLFVFFYCSVLLYYGSIKAVDSIAIMERHFSVWSPYVFPVISMIPLAALLMILQAFSGLCREIHNLRGRA